MTAAQYRKVACPFCGGRVEYDAAQEGQLAECPHCAQEIVTELVREERPARHVSLPSRPRPTRVATSIALALGAVAAVGALVLSLAGGSAAGGLLAGLSAGGVVFALSIVYFLPTLVAERRGHRNALAILATNFFLGWTFLGWVGALVWACTANTLNTEGAR